MKRTSVMLYVALLFRMGFSGIDLAHFHTPVYVDSHLVPWHIDESGPFHFIMDLQAKWWLNAPAVNGWPVYLTAAELRRDYTQAPGGSVPASASSFAILAYLKYYAYTGDERYLAMVRGVGDFVVRQTLTPSEYTAYPDFPIPAGATGDTTPDGGGMPNCNPGEIMPDKGAMVGFALVRLFQATGDSRYLTAAQDIADALLSNIVQGNAGQSPWPFRCDAQTGAYVSGRICGNQVFAVRLFDALIRLGVEKSDEYRVVRDEVWNWLRTFVIPDTTGAAWQHFFEDHSGDEDNPTQIGALETARYLLEERDGLDSQWFGLVEKIILTVKRNWVVHSGSYTAIGEQAMDMTP